MEPAPQDSKKKIIAGLVVLVAIALLAIGAKALTAKKDAPQNEISRTGASSTDNSSTASSGNNSPANSPSSYKDGTYTARGSYTSPGGNESVTVSITLKDNVVTASSVEEGAGDPEAREYQQDFISGYKAFVTGKDVDSIHLSRVSGSSLTSIGFNNALNQIKNQAKS